MSLALFALSGGLAVLAATVTASDASRRDQPWLRDATVVGCVVLFGLSTALLYLDPLAALYASQTGRSAGVVTPREVFGLVGAVGAGFTVIVLSAYGVLTRTRAMA